MKKEIITTCVAGAIALAVIIGMIILQRDASYKNCSMQSSEFCNKLLERMYK